MPKKKAITGQLNLIELTIMTSLPLLKLRRDNRAFSGIGSAVIICYKERYFFCTVQHNINNPELMICVDVSRPKENELKTIGVDNFTTINSHQLPKVSTTSVNELLQNDSQTEKYLDIAFGEIERPFVVPQIQTSFNFDDQIFTVAEGNKIPALAKKEIVYDMGADYSFYGRIKPSLIHGVEIETEERFIVGMKLTEIQDPWLKFDLGAPLRDHANFRGCSGTPVFDSEGNLVALIVKGDDDLNEPYIYGFRIDKLLDFIDLTYFDN